MGIIKTSTNVVVVYQVPFRFPDMQHKFKAYHQRVSMEQHSNIFMYEKPTIFLPPGINLSKFITNTLEHCVNIIHVDFEQAFPSWHLDEKKFIFNSHQTKRLYHSEI